MTATRINADPSPTSWSTLPTTGYASGMSGRINTCRVGNVAFVQFDGFRLTNTGWAQVCTGLPKANVNSAWFQIPSDAGITAKAYVTAEGKLNVRIVSSGNALLDSMVSYPCV